uniref:B-cell antigen receptor complex-associated protein beta chain n=1 Tax=Geotrypetes seraphini TaxID=260995 RepID=A0A6P8NCF4_GEOSA|nr:B-cell antigen receptor complex-associated protein beta chain [Geotrypetes seraphini]
MSPHSFLSFLLSAWCTVDSECRQHPRFIATKRGSTVQIYCSCETSYLSLAFHHISQFRGTKSILYDLTNSKPNFHVTVSISNTTAIFTITNVQKKDSGLYYCSFTTREKEHRTTCPTELKVFVKSLKSLKTRNTMKDAIIMIQTVLIVLFVSVPALMILDKNTRSDPIEEDHTYEGLEIEQAPMYEDIVTLRTTESKWTAAEHPCLE